MNALTCPSCGTQLSARVKLSTLVKPKTKMFSADGISWTGSNADSLQRVENTYVPPAISHSPVVAAMPGSRETPVRAPTIESDVLVPLAHATVPAIAGAILLWLAWIRIGWEKPLFFTFAFFFSIAVIVWLWERQSWHSLLWKLEKWTGADVNKDNQIGKPKPDGGMVWVMIKSKDGGQKSRPVMPREMRELVAEAVRNGEKFSRRSLCPHCLPEESYGPVRKTMLGLGLLRPINDYENGKVPDNAKVELTEAGLEFLGVDPPAPSEM